MSERERYWRRVLGEWRRSGLSRAAFCRRRGISYATLSCWKSRIEGSSRERRRAERTRVSPDSFVEVAVAGGAAEHSARLSADYEIVLAGGQRLRVPRGFDADEVSRLIALVSAC